MSFTIAIIGRPNVGKSTLFNRLVGRRVALVDDRSTSPATLLGTASLNAALDAGAPIIQFSWGMPSKEVVAAVRAAKAKLGMQVTSAESARAALDLGADYLVCQGTEAGGHVQANRGLYQALPDVLNEARQTPVVASGGIGNGQGIRKALLAGASAAMRSICSSTRCSAPVMRSPSSTVAASSGKGRSPNFSLARHWWSRSNAPNRTGSPPCSRGRRSGRRFK